MFILALWTSAPSANDMDLMSIYGADEDDAEALEVDSDDNDLDYYDG